MTESAENENRFAQKVKQTESPNEKQLRIKVNALIRTTKDLQYAKAEVEKETQRLEQMKQSDTDRVPQQQKVVDEAKMMVPHSENRIASFVREVSEYLEKESANISNEELLELARTAIQNGRVAVP